MAPESAGADARGSLERLVERVIDEPELNDRERLLALAVEVKDDPTIFDEKEYFFEH